MIYRGEGRFSALALRPLLGPWDRAETLRGTERALRIESLFRRRLYLQSILSIRAVPPSLSLSISQSLSLSVGIAISR